MKVDAPCKKSNLSRMGANERTWAALSSGNLNVCPGSGIDLCMFLIKGER